jgi:hypothetical protein
MYRNRLRGLSYTEESDVLEKAGIRYSPTPKKPRPKKKEGAEGESKENGSKPKYIHDGKLLFALTQLAIRLYHLNPKRQKRKVMWKATKLAERIWKCSRMLQMTEMTEESGRVGEALEVSGPLEKRGIPLFEPCPHGLGALLFAGNAG